MNDNMNEKIKNDLIEQFIKPAFAQLQQNRNSDFENLIVKNSFPILWFGNLEKYLTSKLKILTLGLNPSSEEFPPEPEKRRFDFSLEKDNEIDFEEYIKSLNEYFKNKPYIKWFDHFNHLLEIFNTSYGYNNVYSENTAIHIDAISPFATIEGYSSLKAEAKKHISANYGIREFISLLEPDIVLTSINENAFEIAFGEPNELEKIRSFTGYAFGIDDKEEPINSEVHMVKYIRLYRSNKKISGIDFFIINGSCRNVPFGNIGKTIKEKIIKRFFEKEIKPKLDKKAK